jgi:hypothetical protein
VYVKPAGTPRTSVNNGKAGKPGNAAGKRR